MNNKTLSPLTLDEETSRFKKPGKIKYLFPIIQLAPQDLDTLEAQNASLKSEPLGSLVQWEFALEVSSDHSLKQNHPHILSFLIPLPEGDPASSKRGIEPTRLRIKTYLVQIDFASLDQTSASLMPGSSSTECLKHHFGKGFQATIIATQAHSKAQGVTT